MATVWRKLGAYFQKPVEVRKELDPKTKKELEEYNEKLSEYHLKVRKTNTELYTSIVPKELLQLLMEHNDYKCTQWGSRKFARLVNLARNILDVEMHSQEGYAFNKKTAKQEERFIIKLAVLMALFFPIPLKKALSDPKSEDRYKILFRTWLVDDFKILDGEEYEIFEAGVFDGVKNEPGNVVLDIFHDALRFEESQFGYTVNPKIMRTVLGKNVVFTAKAKKESERNLTPGWVFNFQAAYDVDTFVDEEKSLADNEAMYEDGIT